MAGKRRIILEQPRPTGLWSRVREWFGLGGPEPDDESPPSGVDFSLARRAERRTVRAFIEAIDNYQHPPHRPRGGTYIVPTDAGLEQRPERLVERALRGGPRRDGGHRLPADKIRGGGLGRRRTELYLHLAQKVVPGTRAFVAAYLGDAVGGEEMDALPSTLLLGEPR